MLVTALNLLPVGQLDGGHVVYAAFGERWHRWISRGTLTTLIVLGVSGAATWLVWAVLLSFLGVRHPRLLDADTPLDRPRKLGGRGDAGDVPGHVHAGAGVLLRAGAADSARRAGHPGAARRRRRCATG